MKTADLLREHDYEVSLTLMAVKPEISLVGCQLRYEEMRLAGTTPRATDPAHPMKIVDQIVSNLHVLEESGAFRGIYLYARAQDCLFPAADGAGTASETLQQTLFGPWTSEEEHHYAFLRSKLEKLRATI